MKPFLTHKLFFATCLSLTLLASSSLSVAESSSIDPANQYMTSTQSTDDSQYGNTYQPGNKEKKRQPNWNKLAKKLGLEESQKDSFIEIMTSQHAKRKATKENSGVKEAMKAINLETQQSLSSVLSEEQLAKVAEHQQQRKNRKHHSHKNKEPSDKAG